MTARAIFPPAVPDAVQACPADARCAEARLTAAALHLWQGGAAARTDAAARLRAAFGTGPGNAIAAALDQFWVVLQDDMPNEAQTEAQTDRLVHLVAATLHGPEAEDAARLMALGIVPAHRMEALMIAARGLALALRRAVLIASGPSRCPVRHH